MTIQFRKARSPYVYKLPHNISYINGYLIFQNPRSSSSPSQSCNIYFFLVFNRYTTRIIKAITPSGLKMNRHASPAIAPTKLKINPITENKTIIAKIINKIEVGFIISSPSYRNLNPVAVRVCDTALIITITGISWRT